MLGSEVTENVQIIGRRAVLGLRSPIRLARECATTRVDEARFLCLYAHPGKARETPLAIAAPGVSRPCRPQPVVLGNCAWTALLTSASGPLQNVIE